MYFAGMSAMSHMQDFENQKYMEEQREMEYSSGDIMDDYMPFGL